MPSVDPAADPPPARGGAYDYDGVVLWEYSPELDHDPDPGEVVWTWVAFEDDPSIGKDRPVAVVGRTDDRRLVAFMLSSKDHDDDRDWISIGTGPWDREGRESWVRRDRVLAVPSGSVRREGAILPKATYEAIVSGLDGAAPRSGAPSAPRPPSTAPARATSPGFFGKIAGLFRRKT
jgi:hypothetical protein